MMTVMVIGANSTVVQEILPLLKAKYNIITAGRKNCDVYCDITKDVSIPNNIDVVINFAATFSGKTKEEIEVAIQTNKFGILRVCEAATKSGVRHVIHISTVFALYEVDDPNISVYARTKREGDELAINHASQHKLPLTILRPSRIYGDKHSFAPGQPFLYKLIDMAEQGKDIEIYGMRDTKRNYIHSIDIAEILLRVINQQLEGVYACVHPKDITYLEIANIAQKVFAKGGIIILRKDKPNIPHDKHIDDLVIYEKICYQPAISMKLGIERIKKYMYKEAKS